MPANWMHVAAYLKGNKDRRNAFNCLSLFLIRFLQVKRHNQQYQSTEGDARKEKEKTKTKYTYT